MQRTNHLFQVKHPNDKENSYYRVVLLPVNPSPSYAINKGILTFNHKAYQDETHSISGYKIEQITSNRFNVQAMVAQNYQDIIDIAGNRGYFAKYVQDNRLLVDHLLVVDIEKEFFDCAIKSSPNFCVPKIDENFIPPLPQKSLNHKALNAFLKNPNQAMTSCLKTKYYDADIEEPIIKQRRKITISIPDEKKQTIKIPVKNRENRLIADKNNPSLHMEIYDYENEKPGFGQDIYLSQGTPLFTAAYRRNIGKLHDWCSNQQPSINKESYLDLTKSLCEEKGNASRIAELFDDYAAKGSGFSALIHFHLFRHNKNIIKAREIAKDLKQNFQHASNIEIVEYLIGKFKELESKDYTVNKEGSFARRINYAILQLTNGLCHSIDEFAAYQEQNNSLEAKSFS